MEINKIIDLIYQELTKKIGTIRWQDSEIITELLGTQIEDFTLNMTMVAYCDSINVIDESVGLYSEMHENIDVSIWLELYDKNDHRMRMPYLRMTRILESKIKNYLKD